LPFSQPVSPLSAKHGMGDWGGASARQAHQFSK
jgi:hypothetical protein